MLGDKNGAGRRAKGARPWTDGPHGPNRNCDRVMRHDCGVGSP